MRTFFQDDTWQSGLEEIRVRVGQPIEFCYGSDNCYLIGKEKEQMLCSEKDYRRWEKDLYHASEADLREMLNYISNYSLYAYKEEIKQGYITIEGGHRVGVVFTMGMACGYARPTSSAAMTSSLRQADSRSPASRMRAR